jgi:hypothetical protein
VKEATRFSEEGGLCWWAASDLPARRVLPLSTNAILKPFVLMAAKFLGPGRLRLDMVKLAHDLDDADGNANALPFGQGIVDDGEAIQPGEGAA